MIIYMFPPPYDDIRLLSCPLISVNKDTMPSNLDNLDKPSNPLSFGLDIHLSSLSLPRFVDGWLTCSLTFLPWR